MDFVIAIDVQGKLYNNEELDGIIEVLEQVGSFQNALYFEEQKEKDPCKRENANREHPPSTNQSRNFQFSPTFAASAP